MNIASIKEFFEIEKIIYKIMNKFDIYDSIILDRNLSYNVNIDQIIDFFDNSRKFSNKLIVKLNSYNQRCNINYNYSYIYEILFKYYEEEDYIVILDDYRIYEVIQNNRWFLDFKYLPEDFNELFKKYLLDLLNLGSENPIEIMEGSHNKEYWESYIKTLEVFQ